MSFLLRSTPALRPAVRCLSTTARRPNVIDSAKDAVKKVDRTVANAAVKGIEKGQEASAVVKDTVGINAKKAEGTASEVTGEAKGKAHELKGEAKGKAEELKGKAQS